MPPPLADLLAALLISLDHLTFHNFADGDFA
jgi:hypothetical protein